MKKSLFVLILSIVCLTVGCMKKEVTVTESSVTMDNAYQENKQKQGTEQTEQKEGTEQKEIEVSNRNSNLDEYMKSIIEQADVINKSLEQDELTQNEMNVKSEELYRIWDKALNYLWKELQNNLPKEEFEKLRDEQRKWITEKESVMEKAGKGFEGGSMYSLVVNSEAAKFTEKRVNELYTLLKK